MEWESSEISTQGFSQENDSTTLTLSSPSQQLILSQETDSLIPSAETKDNACQTESSMSNSVLIDKVEYEELIFKASRSFNLQKEVTKVKEKCFALYGDEGSPEMDPSKFEKICQDAEAPNIFPYIYNALSVERMSENRLMLNKIRTMVIIYVMIFGQSQKSNWFQVALSRTLSQYGISECGLTALRNLGIAAHPRTTKKATASVASNHLQQVQSFFQEATDKGHFIVMFIDDYHNIHTKHRPNEKQRSESVHMATLMVKVFEKIKAVPQEGNESPLSENPADINILHQMINQNMSTLSKSYAQEMPDWVLAKYFDQTSERQRLLVHDYQQTEIRKMRSMENTKLVDSIEINLKSFEDLVTALNHMLENGLSIYLDKFFVPFVGDWPTQFYMRQLAYSKTSIIFNRSNILPFIGPLHISLNSRETVFLTFFAIFKELYSFLFGPKAFLAQKPKPWLQSLLLEVLYGGWSLIRSEIISIFSHCKDIEYLTLINLLDNYCPLVLSIYSIAFKNNYTEHYFQSVLRCWIMLSVFKRRHYDKALLILLTTYEYLKKINHPLFHVISKFLVAFDEYSVENFHSILRGRTNVTDNAAQICLQAREIDACKHELHAFKSWFVPPRRYNFCPSKVQRLKFKAAEFLVKKFKTLLTSPSKASRLQRTQNQPKNVTKWSLPNLFGETIVTNKVLPFGFSSLEHPSPER
ncbi:uncharacterized protein LOC135693193 [Rhopilema esculentum]|uniref:uncharacterized protein LOC135693193 n=1 Tax=Rhopilema esculentum TaxID=499914 RepID=UPI0031E4190E